MELDMGDFFRFFWVKLKRVTFYSDVLSRNMGIFKRSPEH